MPIRRHISGMDLSCVQTLGDDAYHIYHQDEQGSTVYITDPCGSVENSYLYDAFGNVLESREIIQNRMLYTGQQYDQATGQYYLRARYYNPVMGRFTQEDTYRGDGLNLYAYCANNPVVYYDPSGHQPATNACGKGSTEEPKKDPAQVVSEGGEGGSGSNRKLVNINDWEGDVNDPSVRLYGTYDELRNAGVEDGHHIVQNASVKDVSGYSKGKAPAIQAEGPSTTVGTEHYNLTQDQVHATTGGTYGKEKGIGLNSAEKNLGLSKSDIKILSDYVDDYFCNNLGLNNASPIRIPGNRHNILE